MFTQEKLADAVDRARLQMWGMHGVQLIFDVQQFAIYLSEALGTEADPDKPQPKTQFVDVESVGSGED